MSGSQLVTIKDEIVRHKVVELQCFLIHPCLNHPYLFQALNLHYTRKHITKYSWYPSQFFVLLKNSSKWFSLNHYGQHTHTHIHYGWAWDMSDCSQNMHNMKLVRKLTSLFMTSQNIIIIYRNYGRNILNNFDKFCDLWGLWMQMEFFSGCNSID